MTKTYDYDLFVIGAGSGGMRASRVAAAHGARVAVAEEYRVGGTCVIRGCVPKKLLVYGAHFAEDLQDARRFGWEVPDCRFDWPTLRDNVLAEVERLEGIYGDILDRHDVELFTQRATLTGPNEIALADGTKVTAATILIATGATPMVPDIPGAEHGITSNEVFNLPAIPRRIAIAGGGYIANEFAGIFHEFSCRVTLINRGDRILRRIGDHPVHGRLHQIPVGLVDGDADLALGLEIVIAGRDREASRGGDLLHRSPGETLLLEELRGGGQHGLAPGLLLFLAQSAHRVSRPESRLTIIL